MGVLNWIVAIFIIVILTMTAIQEPILTKKYYTAVAKSGVVLVKYIGKEIKKVWNNAETKINETRTDNSTESGDKRT